MRGGRVQCDLGQCGRMAGGDHRPPCCLREVASVPTARSLGTRQSCRFKQLFGYGKDMFLIGLGEQLISASQTILISRALGLKMVAVWTVGTKVFSMALVVTRRVLDFSVPTLAEMLVRREHTQLRERFKAVTVVSALIGGLGAVLIAACNTPFVTLWTHGEVTWTTGKDVLLGVWLIILAVRHCHSSLVGVSRASGSCGSYSSWKDWFSSCSPAS